MKLLITADTHMETLDQNMIPHYTSFVCSTLKSEIPDVFVLAGDTVDKWSLKVGSPEMMNLMYYITEVLKTIDIIKEERGKEIKFYVVKGTEGHDGEVMKSVSDILTSTIGKSYIYVDKPVVVYEGGKSILMMPELYLPTYNDFRNLISNTTMGNKVDVVVFHGMFDFAIKQLKQEDSHYNQSKSVVINSDEFRHVFNSLAIGGHFHSEVNHLNIYYTNSFVNTVGDMDMTKGLHLVDINDYSHEYNIKKIVNPYNIKNIVVDLDFINKPYYEIDSVVKSYIDNGYDINKIVFKVKLNTNIESLNNFKSFSKAFKPKHIVKRIVDAQDEQQMESTKMHFKNRSNLSMEDLTLMVQDILNTKYGRNLEQEKVKELFTIE
ncbi:MAG: hypothetical protein ACRC92_20735 [Peptostreptococcaceae bacterium]